MEIQRAGNRALCELSGRLFYEQLPGLNSRLEGLLEDGVNHLLLQIEQLLYVDSSALGMMLSLNAKCGARGGKLSILLPPENIDALLRSTGLDRVIEVLRGAEARAAAQAVEAGAAGNGAQGG